MKRAGTREAYRLESTFRSSDQPGPPPSDEGVHAAVQLIDWHSLKPTASVCTAVDASARQMRPQLVAVPPSSFTHVTVHASASTQPEEQRHELKSVPQLVCKHVRQVPDRPTDAGVAHEASVLLPAVPPLPAVPAVPALPLAPDVPDVPDVPFVPFVPDVPADPPVAEGLEEPHAGAEMAAAATKLAIKVTASNDLICPPLQRGRAALGTAACAQSSSKGWNSPLRGEGSIA
jgi:hypothetical protein